MTDNSRPAMTALPAERPRKRVRMACDRCRRQKLRCDTKRPCALCVRSAVQCFTDGWEVSSDRQQDGEKHSFPSFDLDNAYSWARNGVGNASEHMLGNRNPTVSPVVNSDSPCSETGLPGGQKIAQNVSSAIELTQDILRQLDPNLSLQTDTSALPGGSRGNRASSDQAGCQLPVCDIIGIELPPKGVVDVLVDSYIESVHWFMLLFHEPSFRWRYNAILSTGMASSGDIHFLVQLMLVLAIGARYAEPEAALSCAGLGLDLLALQDTLLHGVRAHLFDIIDEGGVECVQTCVLLSTFYLYHGKPNLAFAIHGMGFKCAEAICLHDESSWHDDTALAREVKRRVWWALYVVDCFYSIIYGRPRCTRDGESRVSMVTNFDDTTARHPTYRSFEMVDGINYPITIFSYQRYKFNLYKIASRIMKEMHFHSSPGLLVTARKAEDFNRELTTWYDSLPLELRYAANEPEPCSGTTFSEGKIARTFGLQALTLQLAYDNIQILLHRPMLQYPITIHDKTRPPGTCPPSSNTLSANKAVVSAQEKAVREIGKARCWESALRTSQIRVSTMKAAEQTHAASYVGIHMFTASMVLSIVALSEPLSVTAHEAKSAIARIVNISSATNRKALLSAQAEQVMRELMRLILEKEMGSIFSTAERPIDSDDRSENDAQRHPSRSSIKPHLAQSHNFEQVVSASRSGGTYESDIATARQNNSWSSTHQQQIGDQEAFLSERVNYKQALSSLNDVISQTKRSPKNDRHWQQSTIESANVQTLGALGGGMTSVWESDSGGLSDVGQTWLWESASLLTDINHDLDVPSTGYGNDFSRLE
ncbi:fungal-specific transcription factor domain-containing protein [Boeremia exigua]|uniref:fungal-specific transcription factor domain-containing protein n=1 Tax=Boeremia exigua TaxID=749465 RepID=UPI001E8CE71A|nr:fungal-specific transcription factor domain-containing protein [Boeremia exigua]KAH6622451.1 fungal-specific transcription factor domain-containing protein [Boeremia exigua]